MTVCGRPFQTWAAATRKARLPTVDSLTGGTISLGGWYLLTAELADGAGPRQQQEIPNIPARCREALWTLALQFCTARILGNADYRDKREDIEAQNHTSFAQNMFIIVKNTDYLKNLSVWCLVQRLVGMNPGVW